MEINMFRDKNGKTSPKRVLGAAGVLVGLLMAIAKYILDEKGVVSDTLILGILTTSFAALSMGVFETKK